MYDIVPWFGEVIAAFLAIMILVFVTLLCMKRSRRERQTKGGDVGSMAATYTKCYMGGCGESSSTDGGEHSG